MLLRRFPGQQVDQRVLGGSGRRDGGVGADQDYAHRAVVGGVVERDRVVAAGAPFVDHAVGIDQIVVADIAPFTGIGVEGPDRAHTGCPVWLARVERVAVGSVMDDQVVDRVVVRRHPAALAIGAAPPGARDHRRLAGRCRCRSESGGLLGAEAGGIDGVDIDLAQIGRGAIGRGAEGGAHLPEAHLRPDIDHLAPLDIRPIGFAPQVVVCDNLVPRAPGRAVDRGAHVERKRSTCRYVRLTA